MLPIIENHSHYVSHCLASIMETETEPQTPKQELPSSPAGKPRPLDSMTLLGSKGEVEITHRGETYRLRRTRQGKLILTK